MKKTGSVIEFKEIMKQLIAFVLIALFAMVCKQKPKCSNEAWENHKKNIEKQAMFLNFNGRAQKDTRLEESAAFALYKVTIGNSSGSYDKGLDIPIRSADGFQDSVFFSINGEKVSIKIEAAEQGLSDISKYFTTNPLPPKDSVIMMVKGVSFVLHEMAKIEMYHMKSTALTNSDKNTAYRFMEFSFKKTRGLLFYFPQIHERGFVELFTKRNGFFPKNQLDEYFYYECDPFTADKPS